MAIGKRGVFYTLVAVLFIWILYLTFQAGMSFDMRERTQIVTERVESVDYFIGDLEKDIARGTYIATFRALLGIQQHITSTGKLLNDTQGNFEEVLVNGTIGGNYLSVMNGTELNIWIAKIQQEAKKIAVRFNYTINGVRLYQVNPWVIGVDLNVTLNIEDIGATASWKRDQIITSTLNITSFEDPLYAANTLGGVISTIQKGNITQFVNGNDTSGLREHIESGYYTEAVGAPSFVMRLSGNLSNSSYGIESIVNLKKLEDAGLGTMVKSCIDYIYFSNQTPQSWLINNTYNWLRIDNRSGHLETYQVENLTI